MSAACTYLQTDHGVVDIAGMEPPITRFPSRQTKHVSDRHITARYRPPLDDPRNHCALRRISLGSAAFYNDIDSGLCGAGVACSGHVDARDHSWFSL